MSNNQNIAQVQLAIYLTFLTIHNVQQALGKGNNDEPEGRVH